MVARSSRPLSVFIARRLSSDLNFIESRIEPNPPGALFTPPYTTLHNGMIEGGTAGNITAKDCWFTSDIRCLPGESGDDWLARYLS